MAETVAQTMWRWQNFGAVYQAEKERRRARVWASVGIGMPHRRSVIEVNRGSGWEPWNSFSAPVEDQDVRMGRIADFFRESRPEWKFRTRVIEKR